MGIFFNLFDTFLNDTVILMSNAWQWNRPLTSGVIPLKIHATFSFCYNFYIKLIKLTLNECHSSIPKCLNLLHTKVLAHWSISSIGNASGHSGRSNSAKKETSSHIQLLLFPANFLPCVNMCININSSPTETGAEQISQKCDEQKWNNESLNRAGVDIKSISQYLVSISCFNCYRSSHLHELRQIWQFLLWDQYN